MNDLDIFAPAIAAGDADAFARWLGPAERVVRESLRPFAASVDAEAVLQEALLRVWQVAPRFAPDGRPNGLLRLALRIARNLAIDELRRARVAPPAPPDDLERAAEGEAAGAPRSPDPFLRRAIELCRQGLPEKPALALAERLSNAGADPDERLAERLNMRLNTFLQNFTRARKLLAECLRKQGVEIEAELA
ncbi:MAG TPA: sigma-70 family RNA polymerase sigma factor [Polyangiaceae bacterium]|nr:sigma-70 family RNA polymerase sigma factor [Polyangiaceae bacterium]